MDYTVHPKAQEFKVLNHTEENRRCQEKHQRRIPEKTLFSLDIYVFTGH
ncbi:MAG: hypothetical protein K6E31_07945 [bacterium]|nr:hypothetical protein [bacterium]